jgi:hemolysin activation/secretion protein
MSCRHSVCARLALGGVIVYGALLTTPSRAQSAATAVQEQREQAQQQAKQLAQLRAAPDVRLQTAYGTSYRQTTLPTETPCFRLTTFTLEGMHRADFVFLQRYLDGYAGRCIGEQGLQLLAHRASDLMLARGYVTSRLAIPEQNLSSGRLRVVLLAGTLGAVRFAPGSATLDWHNALPLRPGDVLNLRAIEQGLEQLKRVPSQDVKIDIAPGTVSGTSDLVLTVHKSHPWRVTFEQDDSGAHATGKEQGGITLALDQPLGINDLLSVGVTHSAGAYRGIKGTHGNNVNYSVPWDDWTFSLTSSGYGYRQPVTGSLQTFNYTGSSRTTGASATRLIQRDSHSFTSVQLGVNARDIHSYIEGVEVQTQRLRTTAAEVALIHRRYLGAAQLDVRLAYRRGVPWLDGQWQAGNQGGPTDRYGLATLDASLSLPFQMLAQQWLWISEWRMQATGDHLLIEDYQTIGGRYTVRGFDGNTTLGGDHGAYWRNTLNWPLGGTGVSLYGGIDVGRVGGDSGTTLANGNGTPLASTATTVSSHTLSGVVLGMRGTRWGLSWDLFAGWPLQAPPAFPEHRPTAGMQWIYTLQ